MSVTRKSVTKAGRYGRVFRRSQKVQKDENTDARCPGRDRSVYGARARRPGEARAGGGGVGLGRAAGVWAGGFELLGAGGGDAADLGGCGAGCVRADRGIGDEPRKGRYG